MRSPSHTLAAGLCLAAMLSALIGLTVHTRAVAAGFPPWVTPLPLTQRDFRVFPNFTDSSANDNVVPHPHFPGATGAALAIWKAHTEWSAVPRGGDGAGDGWAGNPVLGDGGALFETHYQGLAVMPGGTNDNVHSAIDGGICGGGTFAFTETPTHDGWRIRYCDGGLFQLAWHDGPGAPTNGWDLQGVSTHEVGHALGLGHSNAAGNPTMAPAFAGTGVEWRSIEADDIEGVQAIYGIATSVKPVLLGADGSSEPGGTLVLTGTGFADTGNEVWFTSAGTVGDALVVSGVPADLGGTRLSVAVPLAAESGEVLVRSGTTATFAGLSNPLPLDVGGFPGTFAGSGQGVAGAKGFPVLSGSGDLTPGGPGFTLHLQLVKNLASGLLFVSTEVGALPFKGGTFVPVPVLAAVPVSVGGGGKLDLPGALPVGLPAGTTIVLQAWFTDSAAILGVSATNGLQLTTP